VIAFGLIRARFTEKMSNSFAELATMLMSSGRQARFAPIHHFETMLDPVWKPAIHHQRRMARQPCRNLRQRGPCDGLDLARASGLLGVIIATIKFKTALETDVWSRPQGFDIVKELAAIGCACNTSDKPGSVCGLSFRLIPL
jgi:hypothetical protein